MPARIVVIHDDPNFREFVVTALQAAGHDTEAFVSTMAAIDALEAAERIDLLITRLRFPEGTPHGVALGAWQCASCLSRARRTGHTPMGSANFWPCR
jgi:DNA-binding NtrC family response regulator